MRILLILWLCVMQAATAAPPIYTPVTPQRTLAFPADFGAHPDYRTEWWYVTGWLKTADGKPLGFQVTFFRSRTGVDQANPSAFAAKQLIIGHAALSDPAVGHLLHDQRSARAGFGLAYARTGNLDVKLDDWHMVRGADGRYTVQVRSSQMTFDLTLTPSQPVLLQGVNGYSQKGAAAQHASYYYSEPQLTVTGKVAHTNGPAQTVTGSAWMDHEWSSEALQPDASGWDWIGANLDDGGALMAFQVRNRQGSKIWAHATLRDRSGKVTQFTPDQVRFEPFQHWQSPRTEAVYPVATVLTTGATQWRITPLQPDQELDSRRSTGAVYWEGAIKVERDGVPAGHGYLELTGYLQAIKL
ncbi:lipocalin-like domain-containing protein [Massilia sp. S19_KUP03_FR1]|uniref:lipocalin-like domain-containing protein n=1 Tax=Massilia sp. S19_KUP03_FR1 TaxID=3025503 RepID=UPI002FCD916F